MALKRKKGFWQVSKTQKCSLEVKKPESLEATKQLFNKVVEFYVLLYSTHPELADVASEDIYIAAEGMTVATKNRPVVPSPLPYDCPVVFRRAAIKKALGAFKSWRSNRERWERNCKKLKEREARTGKKVVCPRPPLLPRKYNFNPTFYDGMYKEDTGSSILLKLWSGTSWEWVKHQYKAYPCKDGWMKATPTVVIKDSGITLNWTLERHTKSLGKVADQVKQNNSLTICCVDLNLSGDIAVCTILKSDGKGNVRELATQFIKGNARHQHRRKRLLGKDAIAKSKTNAPETINKANANLWRKLKHRETYEGERVSRRIVEFAKKHGATIIVFEHLGNLRPEKGKYSRRSNSKRQYWLKSKVYNRTKDKALADYGILTVRVSPNGTSRVFAYDDSPVLRGNQISDTGFVFLSKGMGSLFLAADGTIGNADLNASRNIGLRYIAKHISKPVLKQTGLVR
jgi:IS605 OrfB family transposase